MRTWIVASDFSDLSRQARVRAADDLVALGGGRLLFVHIHTPGTGLEGGLDLSMLGTGADADRAAMADAEARLTAEVAALRSNPAYATLDVGMKIEIGRPADHVVEVATREHAERIVVGSHGRRGIERMLLGSVAERIVRLAPCAVLVVKESAGA